MLVGQIGGLASPRIDHHQLAAPRAQGLEPATHVGGGHHAAPRDDGIGTDHQQMAGAIQIRYGDVEHPAEHRAHLHVSRPGIERAGREAVLGPHGPQQDDVVESAAEIVDRGVAAIQRNRVRSPLRPGGQQSFGGQPEGLLPRDLHEPPVRAFDRLPETVGIFVEVRQGRRLRAHVAAREGVVDIAADGEHTAALDLDREAAGGLAQRAHAVDRSSLHGQ